MTTLASPNTLVTVCDRAASGRVTWGRTLFLLLFRTVGFAAFQALFALVFALRGDPRPWQASIAVWPVGAAVVSLLTLALLVWACGREGIRYRDLVAGRRATWRRDLLIVLLLSLLTAPLAYLPMQLVSTWLYGDPQAASLPMFRPLPMWLAVTLLVLMPLGIALSELPAYFGYAMPRLEALSGRRWLAVALPVAFLTVQHAALPLIFDWRFVVWRIAMFLPLAAGLGLALRWRPSLMPYLMVGHFLLDLSLGVTVLMASMGLM